MDKIITIEKIIKLQAWIRGELARGKLPEAMIESMMKELQQQAALTIQRNWRQRKERERKERQLTQQSEQIVLRIQKCNILSPDFKKCNPFVVVLNGEIIVGATSIAKDTTTASWVDEKENSFIFVFYADLNLLENLTFVVCSRTFHENIDEVIGISKLDLNSRQRLLKDGEVSCFLSLENGSRLSPKVRLELSKCRVFTAWEDLIPPLGTIEVAFSVVEKHSFGYK
eukprot:g4550.t1